MEELLEFISIAQGEYMDIHSFAKEKYCDELCE